MGATPADHRVTAATVLFLIETLPKETQSSWNWIAESNDSATDGHHAAAWVVRPTTSSLRTIRRSPTSLEVLAHPGRDARPAASAPARARPDAPSPSSRQLGCHGEGDGGERLSAPGATFGWWFRSDPLVARGLNLRLGAHADQYHLEPAPSTDTNAMTGATLADHRTTVDTVDDFFMASLPRRQPAGDWIADCNERATERDFATRMSTLLGRSPDRRMGD